MNKNLNTDNINIKNNQDDGFFEKILLQNEKNKKENSNKLVSLLNNVSNSILQETPDIVTCIIDSYNEDGTIDVYPIGEDNVIWTIQNQSIYKDIPVGSPVKVFKQDRNNNVNMWIGAVNSIENKKDILKYIKKEELEYFKERINTLNSLSDVLYSLFYEIAKECKDYEIIGKNIIPVSKFNVVKKDIDNYNTQISQKKRKFNTPKNGTVAKGLF